MVKPAVGPLRSLTFQMNKTVWLEVRDSGNNVIYSGTKNAGTKDTIKGAAPLSVVVGAVDALSLSVDGAAYDVKAQSSGNVARLKIQ
jgi:cytoskeleton protein RodZ